MKIIFSPFALQELNDATEYLELQFEGLGQRFRNEVWRAIRRIERYPSAWSAESDNVRRCLLHKFPYKILFSIETDHIYVLAVAHQHREPEYWFGRG